jgi:hypothetical protein
MAERMALDCGPMKKTIENIGENWVCEYTGLESRNIKDFDIDDGILKVEVCRLGDDWLPDFMIKTEKAIHPYRDGGYGREAAIYFELPMPKDITSNGVADFNSLCDKAGGEHNPVIYWSEMLAMESLARKERHDKKVMDEWKELESRHYRNLMSAGDL